MARKKPTPAEEEAQQLLLKPYSRMLIPQDEGGFSAEIVEFPGCFAEGETPEEAYANLERAAASWLVAVVEKGESVPAPLTNYEISGRFALRLPKTLYARAAKYAAREGVSLNQFIVNAVAERLGEAQAIDRIEKFFKDPGLAAAILPALPTRGEAANWSGPPVGLPPVLKVAETAVTTGVCGQHECGSEHA